MKIRRTAQGVRRKGMEGQMKIGRTAHGVRRKGVE
jgi:hypothetical protein